jgi:hypothetical protein
MIALWRYKNVIFWGIAIFSLVGAWVYIRHLQDQNVVFQKELEDNAIQKESLKKALNVKQRNRAISVSSDHDAIMSGLDNNGWLRND